MIEDLETSKDKILQDLSEENERLRDCLLTYLAIFQSAINVGKKVDPEDWTIFIQKTRDTLYPPLEVKP